MKINIENLRKVSVENLENKNQFVITYIGDDGTKYICFQSYKTLIAVYTTTPEYKHDLIISWQYWDYSKTTLKHLKLFVNQYTDYEYESKQQFLSVLKSGKVILF